MDNNSYSSIHESRERNWETKNIQLRGRNQRVTIFLDLIRQRHNLLVENVGREKAWGQSPVDKDRLKPVCDGDELLGLGHKGRQNQDVELVVGLTLNSIFDQSSELRDFVLLETSPVIMSSQNFDKMLIVRLKLAVSLGNCMTVTKDVTANTRSQTGEDGCEEKPGFPGLALPGEKVRVGVPEASVGVAERSELGQDIRGLIRALKEELGEPARLVHSLGDRREIDLEDQVGMVEGQVNDLLHREVGHGGSLLIHQGGGQGHELKEEEDGNHHPGELQRHPG